MERYGESCNRLTLTFCLLFKIDRGQLVTFKHMRTFSRQLIEKIGSPYWQIYSIITCGGKVISTGYNRSYEYGFRSNGKDYLRHAECDAILKLPDKYRSKRKKLRMWVIRNGYKNCKPCKDCLQFISESGYNVKNIYYSDQGCIWDEHFTTINTEHRSIGYY